MSEETLPAEAAALFAAIPLAMQPHALAALRRFAEGTSPGHFSRMMGIQFLSREPGNFVCTMQVDESLYNPGKVAHGGVVYTLIDTVMGGSLFSLLPPEENCVTAELKVNYLRAILAGTITATVRVVQRGRTLAVLTSEVVDGAGNLVAFGVGTFAIIKRR